MTYVSELLSLDIPCDRHAPGAVRDALGEVHDGGWQLDDGLLVASELVTNAVRHSGCVPDHTLQVSVDLARGALRSRCTIPDCLAGTLSRGRPMSPSPGAGGCGSSSSWPRAGEPIVPTATACGPNFPWSRSGPRPRVSRDPSRG